MNKKDIGNFFVIGYQGVNPTDEFLKFVEEWQIGGVIVFARNIDRPENMTKALKRIEEAAGRKIFTAIDQEGGLVMRLLQDCSLFQSAMGLAATGDVEMVEASHHAMAKEMLAMGLNWNLAPVLDINHPDNPGIGARSFGDCAEAVSKYGIAAIKGLQKAGVLACAKHFPGKGNARVDSHLTLPIIEKTAEHLNQHELLPFKRAIAEKVAAIMTAHVFFPAFESAPDLPATLSKSVLTGLLRNQLKFDGLLITDDLEMGAITEKYGIAEAAHLSFAAGADLLLICHQLEQERAAAEKLLSKINSSTEMQKRFSESLARIDRARKRLDSPYRMPDCQSLMLDHEKLVRETHEKSLRFLAWENEMTGLSSESEITIVYPQISALVQVEETHAGQGLHGLFKNSFKNAMAVEYCPKETQEEIIQKVERLSKKTDKLLFFTYNGHLFNHQIEAARKLSAGYKNAAAVALRNPYDLKFLPEFKTRIATFSFRTPAIQAVLKSLQGQLKPVSKPWPVDIDGW